MPAAPRTTLIVDVLQYLAPYEFYPEVFGFCVLAVVLYARGLRQRSKAGHRNHSGAALAFFAGALLIYAVSQTRIDYLSQYMFWIHRFQHLVLHHLAPFLMVLGRPHEVLPYALPSRARARAGVVLRHPLVRIPYRVVQQPVIASVLFVGIIFFWLTPEIHFSAMLSNPLYRLMNGSVFLEGLLFWWLIVDPRGRLDGGLRFGTRIVMLWLVMIPQIMLGAYIGLSHSELYDVYSVCGRAWPISAMTDQRLGGLITWIPAAMMSVIGALVVFRLWLQESERKDVGPGPAVAG
ncbi:MAG TPA: cytochrome c oxidase assembly protein [Gammaproteobacteria bacterium]|nr:cytochrome c oxidase assembly protein [Gammaproteobacteria bacterium]